jgi:hypothetical protein
MARARISSGCYPCYQRSPHQGLLRSVKNFQSFAVICRKPHVASSSFLRATIFQNPEWTLWTRCIVSCTRVCTFLKMFAVKIIWNRILEQHAMSYRNINMRMNTCLIMDLWRKISSWESESLSATRLLMFGGTGRRSTALGKACQWTLCSTKLWYAQYF